jgi:long-chain acyl-CoA synthetase
VPSDRLASDDPTVPSSTSLTPSQPDCWVFDVDGCLIDSLTGSSLRPGARDILEHLAAEGRHVILWSAGGDVYARGRAEQFGVEGLVEGFFAKEGRGADGYYGTAHLPLHDPDQPDHRDHRRRPAVFVDDRPEDLAPTLNVIAVSAYLSHDPFDRGLQQVARRAGLA